MTQRVTIPKGKRSGLAGLDYHVSKVLTLCNVSVPGSSMAIEVLRIPSPGPKYPPTWYFGKRGRGSLSPKVARTVGRMAQQGAHRARAPRSLAYGYLKDLSRPLVDT